MPWRVHHQLKPGQKLGDTQGTACWEKASWGHLQEAFIPDVPRGGAWRSSSCGGNVMQVATWPAGMHKRTGCSPEAAAGGAPSLMLATQHERCH